MKGSHTYNKCLLKPTSATIRPFLQSNVRNEKKSVKDNVMVGRSGLVTFYFPSYAICQLRPYLHKRRKTRRKFAVQLLATFNIYRFPWKKKNKSEHLRKRKTRREFARLD